MSQDKKSIITYPEDYECLKVIWATNMASLRLKLSDQTYIFHFTLEQAKSLQQAFSNPAEA